jgi:hypothetical protein
MAANAIPFLYAGQVCWHDHGRDGVVEFLASFCVLACVSAVGKCASMNCVALASMMTWMKIMKVDLNTVSSRKRPWFEKMQADMLNFDDE